MHAEPFAVPASFTLTVGLDELLAMLKVALIFPVVVGAKVTVAVQEPPLGTVPQSFVSPNSEAFVPERVIELMRRLAVPVFETVTVLCAVLPGFRVPKLIDVGLTDILGALGGVL